MRLGAHRSQVGDGGRSGRSVGRAAVRSVGRSGGQVGRSVGRTIGRPGGRVVGRQGGRKVRRARRRAGPREDSALLVGRSGGCAVCRSVGRVAGRSPVVVGVHRATSARREGRARATPRGGLVQCMRSESARASGGRARPRVFCFNPWCVCGARARYATHIALLRVQIPCGAPADRRAVACTELGHALESQGSMQRQGRAERQPARKAGRQT